MNMISRKSRSVFVALFMAVSALAFAPAHAGLTGETINASGTFLGPSSATVGSGIEFIGIHNYLNFDFADDTLTITDTNLVGWSGFGNYVFSGFLSNITGFSIASNTGFTGRIIDNYSFDAHSITLDMSTGGRSVGSVLVFNIRSTPVPEPSTLALLGLGLVALGFVARKKFTA